MSTLEEHKQSLSGSDSPSIERFSPVSSDTPILEDLEVAQYLGLKDSILDQEVMEKVKELREFFGDLETLKGIDFKLGNPLGSKLDKLILYMNLNQEEIGYKQKLSDINRQKEILYGER